MKRILGDIISRVFQVDKFSALSDERLAFEAYFNKSTRARSLIEAIKEGLVIPNQEEGIIVDTQARPVVDSAGGLWFECHLSDPEMPARFVFKDRHHLHLFLLGSVRLVPLRSIALADETLGQMRERLHTQGNYMFLNATFLDVCKRWAHMTPKSWAKKSIFFLGTEFRQSTVSCGDIHTKQLSNVVYAFDGVPYGGRRLTRGLNQPANLFFKNGYVAVLDRDTIWQFC